MSALDKAKEAAQQVGHRIEENVDIAKHNVAHSGTKASEAIHDTQRQGAETTKVTGHVAEEEAQKAGHAGESLLEKTKHAMGMK